MSVLCCRIPDFLIRLHLRRHPAQGEHPLALLGGDERVWAVSPIARQNGVLPGMTGRQAQQRCPDLRRCSLDSAAAEAEQDAFLGLLHASGLPVEPLGWGMAYVDLHPLATAKGKVHPLCAEMGRSLRTALGDLLQPALGWDSGKFTARLAALRAEPGAMRLVDKADEVAFLTPLPVTLLPLPAQSLQHLHWLGIRTLGQYAGLPESAVWQRFGQAGKLAWRWAQGRDDRPVQSAQSHLPDPRLVDFDPPEERLAPALAALMEPLRSVLADLADRLQGLRHLRLTLHFLSGDCCTLDLTFVEPLTQEHMLRTMLAHRLQTLVWPDLLTQAELHILAVGELVLEQPFLFPELTTPTAQTLSDLAQRLRGRYGPIFYGGRVDDPGHPVAERRGGWQPL
jgi:nucleotidyltransferase/DNA polymerase involved in DNA repair